MVQVSSPLLTGIRPQFAGDACLRTLGSLGDCGLCHAECPVAAIDLQELSVAVNDSCIGCGRCAAVCPTAALRGGRNEVAARTASAGGVEPLHVECERVPPDLRAANAEVPPCLGALGVNELLALRDRAGNNPVLIIDREWCSDCPAGGNPEPPGAAARVRVAALFAEMGMPECAPALVVRPAGAGKRDDMGPGNRSRRAFLRRFVPSGAMDAVATVHGKEGRREEFLALLRRIGGAKLPASAFPEIRIGERCADNRLCASVCPTGALRTYADTTSGIEFDAEHCIACGACVAICPENSVTLAPAGAGFAPAALRLTSRTLRACSRCDAEFAARDRAEELCSNCRKDVGLFSRT